MTRSEFGTIVTAGLATIASSVLGLYVILLNTTFPNIAAHLISATVLSAPAALMMSKLLMPETEQPETLGANVAPHYERENSVIEAAINGAMAGGKLVMGVIVMLLAFLGIVALINVGLEALCSSISQTTGHEVAIRLQDVFAVFFYPLALLIGVPPSDAWLCASLFGERIILTEVPAYQHLATYLADGSFEYGRSAVLAGYGLCGFAHVASVAIFVGGISALVPERTRTIADIAPRALLAATLACLMTAAMAGVFYGHGMLLPLTVAP